MFFDHLENGNQSHNFCDPVCTVCTSTRDSWRHEVLVCLGDISACLVYSDIVRVQSRPMSLRRLPHKRRIVTTPQDNCRKKKSFRLSC